MAKNSTKKKQPRDTWPDHNRFTSKHFRPYTTAIGQASLAWNDLHESLGVFFAEIVFQGSLRANAIWQSLNSDRAKRVMFAAGIDSMPMAEIEPRLKTEIIWLLNQINALEETRNNVIHAPILDHEHPIWRDVAPHKKGVASYDFYGNVRASKLSEKDLLKEYRHFRDVAIGLRRYAEYLNFWDSTKPWPERPRPPNRGQKKQRQGRRRQQPRK